MTAQPRCIEEAEDEVVWWTAANLEFPGAYREQLREATSRRDLLKRAARLPAGQSRTIPQETIDRIMELCAMPDIIPTLLADLCGIVLEWRPGAKEGKASVCPFCGNAKYNFGVNFQTGLFYCWACTEGGSLKWLLMRKSGLGFRPLFERLGAYLGVSVEPPAARGILL